MSDDFKFLHEKAVAILKVYLRAEGELIKVLLKIDECRGYRNLGFKSLFEYADLTAAASLSKCALEKEIAKERPELHVQERSRYVSSDRIELKLGISERLHSKLKQVQDLVSSQMGSPASLEDALDRLVEHFLERNARREDHQDLSRDRLVPERLLIPGVMLAKIQDSFPLE